MEQVIFAAFCGFVAGGSLVWCVFAEVFRDAD